MTTARSRDSSLALARETRERFVASTGALVAPLALAIRERLSRATETTGNAREMQQHRDDFLAFRKLELDWVAQCAKVWGSTAVASPGVTTPDSLAGLSLMGDDAVENNILYSRLALVMQDKVSLEFNELRLRVLELDDRKELATSDVLKPESFAKMLVEQWLDAGLQRPLWTKVQDTLSAQLLDPIVAAYKAANTYLIESGVMPEIDLKRFVKRTGGPASDGAPLGGSFAASNLSDVHTPSATQRAAAGSGATLQGAPTNFPGQIGAFGPAAIGVGMGQTVHAGAMRGRGGGGASPMQMARSRAQGVLLNLKRFVTGRLGGDPEAVMADADGSIIDPSVPLERGAGGAGAGGGSHAFMAAIAEAEQAYYVQAPQYVDGPAALQQTAVDLRRRTAELKRKAPTTADKATVEVVALMFQAILAEERIPFSARVWFARLQMPVLRVAIAEPEFFATLAHPARMLIDRMGSCVMGFDAATISGSALESEIRRVVQVIEQYPETGQRVFKLVYDEFVAFLSKYLTKSESTQKVMSIAQQVEQKETMAIQYTIELRKMLNDMPVRDEIREFLFKVWAEVLAIAALRYGGQDERTATFKRAASELVWAASAKPNRNDRARVIQDLPRLLQRLREGMALLGVVGEPQEAHIKSIGDTLTDAFMSKTEAIAPARIEAMAGRLAHIEDFISSEAESGDLPLDAASIELLLGVDASSIEVVPDAGTKVAPEMLEWAHAIDVGNWFMLDHNGKVSQVQFVWRSDKKQLHLFVSTDGRSFLIQAGRLASYLQAGLLVPAEDETLTARATREALARLDANPERLLN